MKNHKILFITTDINKTQVEYESTQTSKLFLELRKYYDTKFNLYFVKDFPIDKQNYSDDFNIIPLKYSWNNTINKLLNFLFIFFTNIKIIKKHSNADLIWIGLGAGWFSANVFLYKVLFPKKKFFIQLYTPAVNKNKLKRDILDFLVGFNLKFFRYIGGGPFENNIKRFKIPRSKNIPVEIGISDCFFSIREFTNLQLMYIGSLNNREIWESVKGFGIYCRKNNQIDITYDIIGGGTQFEIDRISQEIKNYKLESKVTYHGRLSIDEVKDVFKKCNVGVSYVPVREYYENGSTKTLEYFLAGMAVIATDDCVKGKIVKENMGVLCNDNPESFAEGLEKLYNNRLNYNSTFIRKQVEEYSMENTIKNKYVPYLNKVITHTK